MAVKCFHNDHGYCKFGKECRFSHSMQVCRETSCEDRTCQKRHPRACRNFFLRKSCRFGMDCRYSHSFECEICENLTHLMKKEVRNNKECKIEKEEVIKRMAGEIQKLKEDKAGLEKKVKVSNLENTKLNKEIRSLNDKNGELKNINTALNVEKEVLKRVEKANRKESNASEQFIQKNNEIKEINMKLREENNTLKKDLKNAKDSEKEKLNKNEERLKLKDMEIKSLFLTRKVSVDNLVKLQKMNQNLEKENKDLKKAEVVCKENLPFPCDKCVESFQTAGNLVKHVKNQHENLPNFRP